MHRLRSQARRMRSLQEGRLALGPLRWPPAAELRLRAHVPPAAASRSSGSLKGSGASKAKRHAGACESRLDAPFHPTRRGPLEACPGTPLAGPNAGESIPPALHVAYPARGCNCQPTKPSRGRTPRSAPSARDPSGLRAACRHGRAGSGTPRRSTVCRTPCARYRARSTGLAHIARYPP